MIKYNEKVNGITLVSLVITIIILLILAGVSIAELTGNGLFAKAIEAKEKAEMSRLEEEMQLALTETLANKNGGSITLEDYMDTLNKKESIHITDSYEEDGKQIIVLDNKYVFEVTYENGEISVECIGVNNKLSPKLILKNIKNTTNSITVEITTKRNEGGKVEYYIKGGEYTDYTLMNTDKESKTEGTYTYSGLTQGVKYSIKIVAVAKNKQKAEVLVDRITMEIPALTEADIKFTYKVDGKEIDKETWTNKNVTVTASTTVTGYTLQTSKDGKTWSNETSQTFDENGLIYVALYDGKNYGGAATGNIINIDKEAPTINSLTQGETTTSSIQVSASATDTKSGVNKYRYSSDGGTTWSDYTTSTTYKLENLTKGFGCSYLITVEVSDKAGNVTTKNQEMSTVNDNDYYIDTKDKSICYISGRYYYKTDNTPAIVAVAYMGDYIAPILVSTSSSAVDYYTTGHLNSFTAGGSVNYRGTTYYYSANDWWMQNYFFYISPTYTTLNTRTNSINFSNYGQDGVKMLLDKYFYDTSNKKYEISYEANNGNNAPDRQIYSKGSSVTITSSQPTRDGYHLLGWSTNSNSTTAEYLPGNTYNINGSITLYAVWQKHDFSDQSGICTICKKDMNYLSSNKGGENWNSGQILNYATGFSNVYDCCRGKFNGSWNIHSSCNLCKWAFDNNGGIGSASDYSETDGNVCMIIYKNAIDVTNIDKIIFKCQLDENADWVTNKTKIGLCNSNSLSKASDYYNFQQSTEVTDKTMNTATYVLQLDVSNYTGNYYLKVTTERLGGTAAGNTVATKINSMYPIYK